MNRSGDDRPGRAVSIAPIRLTATTTGSPAAAWAALTEPAKVLEWFTEATPVGAVGAPYRLDFGDGSVIEGRIVELEPGRRLAYTWAWADAEPRGETLVSWTIEALPAGGTAVTLEHGGWAEAGADEATRNDHAGYWEGYLEDLVAVLDEAD
ncbi:MAG TPA: SRPBCC domain-containing protein [Clostridia bacterium]|nr:SRPBCC domain-containing protein [Clostridia bacterium]